MKKAHLTLFLISKRNYSVDFKNQTIHLNIIMSLSDFCPLTALRSDF